MAGVAESRLQRVVWDGVDERGIPVGSGVYLIKVRDGKTTTSQKVTLVK